MKIEFETTELRPLVEAIVKEVIADPRQLVAPTSSQLAFSEPEAAGLLGVKPHVLRDLRLRGEVEASVVGRRIVYQKDELIRFLNRNRWEPA